MSINNTKHNGNMHITHIASGDLWAGAEVQLYTLCKTLNNMPNIKVSVILLNHGTLEDKLREQNICVEVLDETQLSSARIFVDLIKALKRSKPNIVHTHRSKENILGSLAAKIAGNITSLRTAHGAPEHRPGLNKPHKLFTHLLDWLTARFIQKKVIAVSEDLEEILAKNLPENKLATIENGVDIDALVAYKRPLTQTNQQSSFKIGLVGRLVPIKRVDLYIRTARHMQDHHPELSIYFHIYGEGPLQDELSQLSYSLGVNNIVRFEGHCNDVHKKIASLDALVITSDHEGLPMTLLETMAIGTPIVAHDIGGIAPPCQHGECCWLYKKNSVEEISKKLYECISSPELTHERSQIALNQAAKKYSAETNTTSYIALYNNLIHH